MWYLFSETAISNNFQQMQRIHFIALNVFGNRAFSLLLVIYVCLFFISVFLALVNEFLFHCLFVFVRFVWISRQHLYSPRAKIRTFLFLNKKYFSHSIFFLLEMIFFQLFSYIKLNILLNE